jgi:hypothetical protein
MYGYGLLLSQLMRTILSIRISIKRNILVAEQQFIQSLIKMYGKHNISTDGGT